MLAPHRDRPHAVVIGSGFGGLAAGVRLGARGYRTTILEKLEGPGGRARVFHQDGFTFDAGPTIVTAPFLFEELWQLCGRKLSDDVDLRSLSPFYRIRFDSGETFDCSGDADAMRAEVARLSPADVEGYERFMQLAEKIYAVGFERLGDVPFSSMQDMIRVIPELIRLQSYRSVHGLVSKYVRDPRIRLVLSFHSLFIGGNPFSVTSIYGLISFLERRWGVHFPIGGMGKLVDGLVSLVQGQGGEIRYGCEVEQIIVQNGAAKGVRLASGEIIKSDIVVSNADSAWTYRHLIPENALRRWTPRKIEQARYSMGLFVWYFGTSRRYPNIPHHTILLGPRYKDLLRDIFKKKHLAEDMSLYLHRPTATDPSLAPEGCDAFYVLSPVPNLDGATDWRQMAEPYRQAVARRLSEIALPGFEDHIVTSRMISPLDFETNLLSFKGAGFGLEPVLTQSAWFRPHNKSEDIENLFLVGAGTHPGAGVPGVLSSARILEKLVPHAATFA
ncbi:phytoene desaturase [Hyphomicrobium sp.]|uniref:phytoene desaturase n=1 Tax=Hyphomicrobium sp. TaxID=82 RepID=UPI000FBDACFE|nr:phytoene desaturase [Hyphomicrobium sp.]RUP00589.1 MAG: phytoene desaturase [Hyphomicrobium sp.]